MKFIKTFLCNCYTSLNNMLLTISGEADNSMYHIPTQFTFYIAVCALLLCSLTYYFFTSHLIRSTYFESEGHRVMIVTSHPDDEVMFFGPVIVRLVNSNRKVYLMCLSNGNADNKGHLRKTELANSCQVMGIPAANVFLLESQDRLDGFQFTWKSEPIAKLIQEFVESLKIDTIVTFDEGGVSGHPNHIAVFHAMSYLSLRNWLPAKCRVFLLDSVGIVRKYSSFIDSVWSFFTSDHVFFLSLSEQELVKEAMRKHQSQYVWFRKLYMIFSRYTIVNTFHELPH